MSKGLSKEDTKQEHPLQAIVLCDGWGEEERWGPLVRRATEDEVASQTVGENRPWCLLPLLTIPLLAWTLECLVTNGVEEAFLFVREGVEQVREWLKTSTYSSHLSGISITLRPTTALTPGDVLREVDGLGILAPADFLVVQAGYVGNILLAEKVKEFTTWRKEDPTVCMSCVVTPRKSPTATKLAVHVLSSENQLLHYEESRLYPKLKNVSLPREALAGGKEVKARADLEAVGAVICSIEVPALFTENFDYQCFYPDFVNGILTSDLLGKTICCTLIGENSAEGIQRSTEWADVVGNTRSYDSISKSILARRAYPLVPDENMPETGQRYEQRRGRVYYGEDLDLSRTCTIASTSLLGSHLSVGEQTSITQSILSPHVFIGASCSISGSYIFEGVRIENGCSIHDSILGEGAFIGAGSVVEAGSLVGAGVRVGSGAKLHDDRVSLEEPEERYGDSGLLGKDCQGFLWPPEGRSADEDEDEEEDRDSRNFGTSRLGAQLEEFHLSSSSSSLSSMSRTSSGSSLSSLSHGNNAEVAGISNLAPASSQNDFLSECTQSLDRSFAEGHTVDNAAIELKTLRMASNVPLSQVRDVVVPYVLARCSNAADVPAMIARWGGLIATLTGEHEESMKDCLLAAQTFVSARVGDEKGSIQFFRQVLRSFYEEDVVSEDAVFAWYKGASSRSVGGEMGKKLWIAAKPFVEALAEDSDDDEDESD